jgi:ABC-type sugar transport system ATPase subunit
MNVRKNMTFGLKFNGVPPAERERRVVEAARMLRLEELLERYPRDLSGGQRQRVAIGRAIVREPAVFLFDEPLSNLDAALRVSTRVEIAKLHRTLKATIVYVTHDQVEAMTLADRIVVMNKGRIEQIGKPLDLYYAPANLFVAGFIGSPAMNFFEARVESVEAGRVRVAGTSFRSLDLPATSLKVGDALTVGVRPEHLAREMEGPFAAEGVVELVERLGESSFAYVRRTDDRLFVAEVRGRQTPTPGERMTLIAAARDVHVFDASGLRVSTQNNS